MVRDGTGPQAEAITQPDYASKMRVFFSHASEDKPVVEQVLARVQAAFPDVSPWLDRLEIKGGDDLVDKIGEGIDGADKFRASEGVLG